MTASLVDASEKRSVHGKTRFIGGDPHRFCVTSTSQLWSEPQRNNSSANMRHNDVSKALCGSRSTMRWTDVLKPERRSRCSSHARHGTVM